MRAKTLVVLFTLACSLPLIAQKNLNTLKKLMSGEFTSQQQASTDTNFYNISLVMVPIWENTSSKKEFWLYVEQAVAKIKDRPYRQRVYKVSQIDNRKFVSEIYELAQPKDWILAWQTPSTFQSLKKSELISLNGCEVTLQKKFFLPKFSGSTSPKTCNNIFRGASYATSEVEISKSGLKSLDRGYNADGVQIWGSENGPYIFNKINNE